ncbi:MAG TPA: hypothetical protein DD381_03165 [Lentisphaeria bacterium]|nr:MAG: hypothetical protein A2X47_03085 [Lentisphaerae bacterium GWF2_38_69]HBM15333.1 hypothetical protein [Lentisphaeria bacterium]
MTNRFFTRLRTAWKKGICLFLYVVSFSLIFSCSNVDDSLPGDKKENPNNYTKDPIMPVESKPNTTSPSDEKIKPVAMMGHSVAESEIDSLDEQKIKDFSQNTEPPFYSYFAEQQKDFNDENRVTISFNAAPIEEVVPAFAKILDFNFYLDPAIKGTVTMSVDGDLAKSDGWQIFEQILIFNGAYCSVESGIVHILPLSDLAQESLHPGVGRYQSNVSVTLFRLKNIKSSNLAQQIKPFMSNGGVIIDIADQNSLLIVEIPMNMPKIRAVINMLDVNSKHSWPRAVIKCSNITPSSIAAELTRVLPVLGFPVDYNPPDNNSQGYGSSGGSSGSSSSNQTMLNSNTSEIGAINLQVVDRLQLLVVSAANDEVLGEVKKWADVLDRSDVGDQDQIFIYNIHNANADDLIQTLSILFNVQGATLTPSKTSSSATGGSSSGGLSGGSGGLSGGSSGGLSGGGSSMRATAYDVTQVTSQNTQQGGSQAGSGQTGVGQNTISIYDYPMRVMADAKNQRLIVRCIPRAYAIVKALLDRIDTMPPQALLTVTVADISLENDLDVGVQAQFKTIAGDFGTDYGLGDEFPAGGAGKTDGFSWVYNSGLADATFHTIQTEHKTTMLANPEILVQSHSPATISIGQSVPINTGSTNSGQGGTTTSYDYKDVGIIVQMTPHITKGGLINLEFSQTNSKIDNDISSDSAGGNPTFTQEVLTTVMNVPDGGTIIIGGLIMNNVSDVVETIPFIGNLPFLSRMVGSSSLVKTRSELLVLITAKIITKTNELEQMNQRYLNSVKLIKESFTKDEKDNSHVFQAEDINKLYIKGD